jgi:thioredoxin-related protein
MDTEPEFSAQVARFVPLEVDLDTAEGKELQEKFNVGAIPDIVFVKSDGTVAHRFKGAVDEPTFREHADKAEAAK